MTPVVPVNRQPEAPQRRTQMGEESYQIDRAATIKTSPDSAQGRMVAPAHAQTRDTRRRGKLGRDPQIRDRDQGIAGV